MCLRWKVGNIILNIKVFNIKKSLNRRRCDIKIKIIGVLLLIKGAAACFLNSVGYFQCSNPSSKVDTSRLIWDAFSKLHHYMDLFKIIWNFLRSKQELTGRYILLENRYFLSFFLIKFFICWVRKQGRIG